MRVGPAIGTALAVLIVFVVVKYALRRTQYAAWAEAF